jgi:putative CocE/NonD family hydrolase
MNRGSVTDCARDFAWLALLLGAAVLGAHTARADAVSVTHRTEWSRMRDGALLPSEVYLPEDARGPLPVILLRSPYNSGEPGACDDPCRALVASGYAVVNQDVRGTGRAGGVMSPFIQEREDGYDAVEWAAVQPWSNGKVGLWGISYGGVTVLQAAAAHPPHLVAAVAIATASDYHDHWVYVNGVFDLWFTQSWLVRWANDDGFRRPLVRSGVPWAEVHAAVVARESSATARLPDWNRVVPLGALTEFDATAPFYRQWLAHPDYDRYWAQMDLEQHYRDIRVPVLFIGGWYDIFSVGTLRNFTGVRTHGGSAVAREQSRLVMYPACHNPCNEALTFAPDLWKTAPQMNPRWWDHWLRGIDTGVTRTAPASLYVMAPPDSGNRDTGFWTTADNYPLPATRRIRLRLGSGGHANSSAGDGVLAADSAPPLASGATGMSDHFRYDPGNPVPTRGGALCCVDSLFKAGPFDQAQIEQRNDVLVYTSAPLEKGLTVIGPVTVDFWASSSARDTDFTAKLVDVRPDGVALNLLDRVINARLRRGSKLPPAPIEAGRPYEYRLTLGDTAVVFGAGHRIRLEIASSNFPHFARNPNTGSPAAVEGDFKTAEQTLLHDAAHSSYVELSTPLSALSTATPPLP